ncbi:MAG TPA: transcriptional repressor [Acidimicrobiales bacterium]
MGAGGERVDELLALVRERGGRITTCRRALLSALVDAQGHMTADALAERVHASHPDIHRSTIYRSLNDLDALDVVEHVHLGHGPAVYHLADDLHRHLVCETCGAVVEVPDDLFRGLARAVADGYGFRLQPGHFALLGTCAACSPD